MQGALKQRRHQTGGLLVSVMKEKEEELALFLEMRKREKERNDIFLKNSVEFDPPIGSKPGTSPIFNISTSTPLPARKNGVDDFLNSENDKNDYDWLLTPPATPLFTSLEMESRKTIMSQLGTPKARSTKLQSRLSRPQQETVARSDLAFKQPASFQGLSTSSSGIRMPSSSGIARSRPATPTGRPTLTTISKPSRSATPASRATLPSTKPIISSARTPLTTTKDFVLSSKSCSRSSTPINRSSERSSTPTSRSSIASSVPTSRASTPTRRPSPPSSTPSISVPVVNISSTISKLSPTALRIPVVARELLQH